MTPQFGLIAEQVAEINPNLVIYDADGKPYTVRYDAVNAMLLNEFLKARREMQEQKATIAELKAGVATLTAVVKEQAAQIQKVSAQLEVNKPAPQTVLNNQ
jgi:ATP/maltotriose-dependent transcriptional regulator MalT